MSLNNTQSIVDEWIKINGVRYFNELTNMALLSEEVGELASYIVVKPDRAMKVRQSSRTPKTWQAVGLRGRVTSDEWGNTWFAAEAIQPIEKQS